MEKQLIAALGGVAVVADALSIKSGVVRNWLLESRSIPWKYRPALARLAEANGVEVPAELLAVGESA